MDALVVTTDGFEDSEFSYPYYRLQEAGLGVDVATPDGDSVSGKHDYEFDADAAIDDRDPDAWADDYDLLVVPGGRAPENLRTEAPRPPTSWRPSSRPTAPWRPSATASSC